MIKFKNTIIYKLWVAVAFQNAHFIYYDYKFYQRYKWLIKLLISFNKNYISCEIWRKEFKRDRNVVVVGLKWSGRNVNRQTNGWAKKFIKDKHIKCIYCCTPITDENATTDHIVPICRGGNNVQVNLIVSCRNCNGERGDYDFYEYLQAKNKRYRKNRLPFV